MTWRWPLHPALVSPESLWIAVYILAAIASVGWGFLLSMSSHVGSWKKLLRLVDEHSHNPANEQNKTAYRPDYQDGIKNRIYTNVLCRVILQLFNQLRYQVREKQLECHNQEAHKASQEPLRLDTHPANLPQEKKEIEPND